MRRAHSLEKILMLGKTGAGGEGDQRMRWLDSITRPNGYELEQTPGDSGRQKEPGVLQSMGSQREYWSCLFL